MDWDNLRFFLAVARKGSIRAAAAELTVNHSTVTRRITAFEKQLSVRLFERLPNGYALTPIGEEMLKSAQQIEDEIVKLDRQVNGRDAQLNGTLRVTMPTALATHLIMPDIAAFTKMYPNIQLELAFSNEEFNLRKREAGIAIRITPSPPDYLVGRLILQPAKGVYASHDYLNNNNPNLDADKMMWIGWEELNSQPSWIEDSYYSASPVKHIAYDLLAQLEAVKSGLGIAMLPCFLADKEPSLKRLELMSMKTTCGALWILTHEDFRVTGRVKAFIDFMQKAFETHRDLMEGRCYLPAPKIITSLCKPNSQPCLIFLKIINPD